MREGKGRTLMVEELDMVGGGERRKWWRSGS